MKKSYLFAALVAMGAMTSCSNDTDVTPGAANQVENDGRQPIMFSLGTPSVSVTRGTGSVGDLEGSEENTWQGESLRLLMLNRTQEGTPLSYAVLDPNKAMGTDNPYLFENEEVTAPSADEESEYVHYNGGVPKYYPLNNYYDFFAYHLDNAGDATIKKSADEETFSVDFTIDGSQDLMVAKAEPNTFDLSKLTAAGVAEDAAAAANLCYSSKAARYDVQPRLQFKHLLTRLKFSAIAGDAKAAGFFNEEYNEARAVKIQSVEIIGYNENTDGGVYNKGEMAVAYTVAPEEIITWDENSKAEMVLKQRKEANKNLEKLDAVSLFETDKEGAVAVGEALLVKPEMKYTLRVTVAQQPDENEVNNKTISFNVELNTGKEGVAFMEGSSYNVTIKMFGLQKIEAIATLTGWADGGDVTLTPEDEGVVENN
ncbi:MAG: fimbrillin family protein [Clostridium sp.]|nr:fimbrillin family protein [Clostridium sp.]